MGVGEKAQALVGGRKGKVLDQQECRQEGGVGKGGGAEESAPHKDAPGLGFGWENVGSIS